MEDLKEVLEEGSKESPEVIETPETPEEPVSQETPEVPQKPETPAPEPDDLELFKSIRDEVGEKRFDGLMAGWQRDRRALKDLQDKPAAETPAQSPEQVKGDEAWIDVLDTQLERRRTARETKEDSVALEEVNSAVRDFPELKAKEIVDAVIKYSDNPRNPISAFTAANFLMDTRSASKAKEELSGEDARRKREAGRIAGKAGVDTLPGIRPYDPEKDKDKSYQELMDEGREEVKNK